MLGGLVLFSLVLVALGLKPQAKGLILGGMFSALNLVLMSAQLSARLAPGSRFRAAFKAVLGLAPRLIVLAAPLAIAHFNRQIGLAGAVIGIFSLQIAILTDNLVISQIMRFMKPASEPGAEE